MTPSAALRFILAAGLVAATALVLNVRVHGDIVPQSVITDAVPDGDNASLDRACTSGLAKLQDQNNAETVLRLPLFCFPAQLAHWDSTQMEMDPKVLEVLGAGDFMERKYQDPADKIPPVYLFIAYFPSQRAGDTIHS